MFDATRRRQRPMGLGRLLRNPAAYTICAPVLALAGAATPIIAPMLLTPPEFIEFSLLMAFYQFICSFDLGLARLVDRQFAAQQNATDQQARNIIAARLLIGVTIAGSLLCLTPVIGGLYSLAGIAGVCFMIAVGPVTFYRAQSNIFMFTLAAILVQLGLGLPRLIGLMTGGIVGCIAALSIWYGALAALLNSGYLRVLTPKCFIAAITVLPLSIPLFAFEAYWSVYLLTSRWASIWFDAPHDAGLFAFGANLVWIGAAVVSLIAQLYYPRHLSSPDGRRLVKQIYTLLITATFCLLLAMPLLSHLLGDIFPKFAAAGPSTAAILVSGVPIAISGWLFPLLIATSRSPWRESTSIFGSAILMLVAGMWAGNRLGHLSGQAWGCTLAAFLLLVTIASCARRGRFLSKLSLVAILSSVAASMTLCLLEWVWLFGDLL